MRRLEDEKIRAGKQAMRSQLWRQLVEVWREMKKTLEDSSQNSSQEEDDPWMEGLNLTDDERAALQELKKWWYVKMNTNYFNSRKVSARIPDTSRRQPSHEEEEKPAQTTKLLEIAEERQIGQSEPEDMSRARPPSLPLS